LHAAAERFGTWLERAPFVGDKQSDVDAAIAVGARPILVGDRVAPGSLPGIERYPDLAAAARVLIDELGAN
jgi:phosphoglycolate phosphatase-like HAD superfamily hydrolase